MRIQPLEVDLTAGGALSPKLLRRLDQIAQDQIVPFNACLARLSAGRERDIDWWVCRPASRNNFVSGLFNQCVQLVLLRELAAEGHALRVLVDNAALATVLKAQDDPQIEVMIHNRLKTWLALRRQDLHNLVSCLFHGLAPLLAALKTRNKASFIPGGSLILLDTFVLRDSFNKGAFVDRYYTGALDALTAAEAAHVYYVPQFYRIRDYFTLMREIRQSGRFLVMQDHVHFRDYAFACGHWRRVLHFCENRVDFADFNIAPLLNSDLWAGRFARSTFQALLYYRFWLRAAKLFDISRIVDWYEGQDIDHALAAAIQWTSSGIPLIGLRPACSSMELAVTPADHEIAAGVVPHQMAVVGTHSASDIAHAFPELEVHVAPGFRYQSLQSLTWRPEPRTILVTLSLSGDTISDFRALFDARPELVTAGTWSLKRHPAMPDSEARTQFGGIPAGQFHFVDGDFYDWLVRSAVVIGFESSALMEAVAVGVPVICMARGNVPTKNPIPEWVDRDLWRVCYDADDLLEAIETILSSPRPAGKPADLREQLLSPATQDRIRELLGLA